MPERRHISDETWAQHRQAIGSRPVSERINYARQRVNYYSGQVRDNIRTGAVGITGLAGGFGALHYFDTGPSWLKTGMAVGAGILALGNLLKDKDNRQRKKDWEEITAREISVSRPEIAREDTTLSRAVYEGQLIVTTDDEVANLKQALDYLRQEGIVRDGLPFSHRNKQPKLTAGIEVQFENDIEDLGKTSIEDRKQALLDKIAERTAMVKTNVGMSVFSGPVGLGTFIMGYTELISKWWGIGIGGFLSAASAGGIIQMQEARRQRKRLKELHTREEQIANHQEASGDEILARSVYELDLHPTDEQISNLKRVLDSLRRLNVLKEE